MQGWPRMAACTRLGFFALLRPCEFLEAKRSDLVLAQDLCRDPLSDGRIFVNVGRPRTKGAGPRTQYGKSDDWLTHLLWQALGVGADPAARLWPGTAAAYRAKWNKVCQALDIPFTEVSGVTPASLRGGGASHLYETTEDSELVRHRGRWASSKMCEIYIQEVGGHQFFANLGPNTRTLVAHRAAQVGEATRRSLLLLQEEVPPAYHYTYFSDMARSRER